MRKLKIVGSTAMLLALISGSVIKAKPAKADNVSVYGAESAGPTASGEWFNPEDFTCAHPFYAFGTILKVSLGEKWVTCRVNDRSPWSFTWDVSWAAGRVLGLTDGIGRCECPVEILWMPEAA